MVYYGSYKNHLALLRSVAVGCFFLKLGSDFC